MMNIWERKVYKIYRRLNSIKDKRYDCKIRFSTNPYSSENDLPKKVFDSIIANECFVLCNQKKKGYIYNPITLTQYTFKSNGVIIDFQRFILLHDFINSAQSDFPLHRCFLPQTKWSLHDGRINIF